MRKTETHDYQETNDTVCEVQSTQGRTGNKKAIYQVERSELVVERLVCGTVAGVTY